MIQERENLKEKVVHGTLDFPLCVYRSNPNQDENIILCHWHDEVEILYLASGKAVFYLDTVPQEICAGEAVIINRGTIHSGTSEDFKNCIFFAVVFDFSMLYSNKIGDNLSKYLIPINKGHYMLPAKISSDAVQDSDLLEYIRSIIDAYINQAPAYQLSIISSLYAILGELITQKRISAKSNSEITVPQLRLEQFKTVLTFIKDNYNRKISIRDMAEQINMSQYHFCRFFKSMTGETPFEYLIGYRIYQAELLLREPGRKIIDIALDVGFNNFSYFIKCFKEYKKMTPARYRVKFTENSQN